MRLGTSSDDSYWRWSESQTSRCSKSKFWLVLIACVTPRLLDTIGIFRNTVAPEVSALMPWSSLR